MMSKSAALSFGTAAANDNHLSKAKARKLNKKFKEHYDTLLSEIWFATEAESILPHNIEKTKEAFRTFLKNMDWPIAELSFEELLKEKTGEFQFRADGETPNWYHEFRECLWALNFRRNGLISERNIHQYGGSEVLIATILRHDSWEDFGKSFEKIIEELNKHLKQKGFQHLNQQTEKVGNVVDFLTRKIPVLENGEFKRKPNGKILKEDRFKGDVIVYYRRVLSNPFSAFGKLLDGNEGMCTRVGVLSYTVEDDKKYADERRMLYGRQKFESIAIEKYPFLKKAIRSADHMLGITTMMLETLNDFAPDSGLDSSNASPINIDDYLKHAPKGFKGLPPAFHPINIKMERMRSKADRENDGRVSNIISKAFLPALINTFPNITIYSMRGSAHALPNGDTRAPIVP